MKIYNFPIKCIPSKQVEFQPIDLNYIVSVGTVSFMSYTGSSYGESFAYFDISIKIGQSIRITQPSGTLSLCPEEVIKGLQSERLKLIEAWKAI